MSKQILSADPGTYRHDAWLTVVTCPSCGCSYGIPYRLYENASQNPEQSVICPFGHSMHWPGRTLEQQLADAEDRLARERARHDQTQARLHAQRGAATRARNQRDAIKALTHEGICPVDGCSSRFKNLDRHMASKHPGYATRDDLPHGPVGADHQPPG